MATRAQKAKVGIFLVVCFVFIGGSLTVVSGYKHEEQIPYWIEFDESVLGLSQGAIVYYRGLPVGTVKNMRVNDEGHALVDILISPSKVTLHKGVEAKTVIYSLATGILVISLEGGLLDAPQLPSGSEIPAKRSLATTMTQSVETISARVETLLEGLENVVGMINTGLEGMESGSLTSIAEKVSLLLSDADTLLDEATVSLREVKDDARVGMEKFSALTEDLQKLSKNVDETVSVVRGKVEQLKVGDTEEKLASVLESMGVLAKRLNESVSMIETVTRSAMHEADNVEYGLRETLRTASETLESVRALADSIEEDPSQLVWGKGKSSTGGK